jgi:hypothetical protein
MEAFKELLLTPKHPLTKHDTLPKALNAPT